jgi:hypothetical protein
VSLLPYSAFVPVSDCGSKVSGTNCFTSKEIVSVSI